MPTRIPRAKWEKFYSEVAAGRSITQAAATVGIHRNTAYKNVKGQSKHSMGERVRIERAAELPDVKDLAKINPKAKRALDDFGYFRRRYFGRIASPWQEQAANQILEYLATDRKEFVVINCPPGSGKSTAFTHDIPAWLICRDRTIRILIGSRTHGQARRYVANLRDTLERPSPWKANSELLDMGLAFDAETTLIADFGRFKPTLGSRWRGEDMTVAQYDDITSAHKESTASAFGMDSGFLGGRYDFIIWDDLVDKKALRTSEAAESQRQWWDSEAESRLEPGGLLVLQGQRMAPGDLYRYALDMPGAVPLDEDGYELPGMDPPPKYHHIIYRAHDEDKCSGAHPRSLPPWPDSCLLEPRRLPWQELRTIQSKPGDKYRILYQQEDVDPDTVLVDPLWVEGGLGADGVRYPGCWDDARQIGHWPHKELEGMAGAAMSIGSVDPSGERNWGVEWWSIHPTSDQHFLCDLFKGHMMANQLLDHSNGRYSGLMHEWQIRSVLEGHPITHWIIEINAAQRFLLAYEFVKNWAREYNVMLLPHSTTRNKLDPDHGIDMLRDLYRFGKVRLPGSAVGLSKMKAKALVDEATRYPYASTTDLLMAQWFVEYNLPNLRPIKRPAPRRNVPSWVAANQGFAPANPHLKAVVA